MPRSWQNLVCPCYLASSSGMLCQRPIHPHLPQKFQLENYTYIIDRIAETSYSCYKAYPAYVNEKFRRYKDM